MTLVTCIEGPVQSVGGQLVLQIPLASGGQQLVDCTRGIGEVDGEILRIVLQTWLAKKLGISEGNIVTVDNANGKFNIRPS